MDIRPIRCETDYDAALEMINSLIGAIPDTPEGPFIPMAGRSGCNEVCPSDEPPAMTKTRHLDTVQVAASGGLSRITKNFLLRP